MTLKLDTLEPQINHAGLAPAPSPPVLTHGNIGPVKEDCWLAHDDYERLEPYLTGLKEISLLAYRTATAWEEDWFIRLYVTWRRKLDQWFRPGTFRRKCLKYLLTPWIKGCRMLKRSLEARGPLFSRRDYRRWIEGNEPHAASLREQEHTRFVQQPTFDLFLTLHRPSLPLLQSTIESVLAQSYARWRLVLLVGEAAEDCYAHVDQLAAEEHRIHVHFSHPDIERTAQLHKALRESPADWIAVLDQDDRLAPFALLELARAINQNPDVDFLYGDEDKFDRRGRTDPVFKPAWSPDTLRSHDYIGNLAAARTVLAQRAGVFTVNCGNAMHYDFVLRCTEQAGCIRHIPKVLYHRHQDQGNAGTGNLDGVKVLEGHLRRLDCPAQVAPGLAPGTYQVQRPLPRRPLVSIIIPNRDQAGPLQTCLESLKRSHYQNLEVIIVENHSKEAATFSLYASCQTDQRVRVISWKRPFNYPLVNNFGARHAQGDVLLFLNNDIEAINDDWLERMLEHVLRPEVGIVGAKLYYPDCSIQHAGVVYGIRGGALHMHRMMPGDSKGYHHRLVSIQNLSAVTGACLMIRKDVFDEIGGFDPQFAVNFNDTDLCLMARQRGYLVVWTPFAELYHHESKTRGGSNLLDNRALCNFEMRLLNLKWDHLLPGVDPYFSPNLDLEMEGYALRLKNPQASVEA